MVNDIDSYLSKVGFLDNDQFEVRTLAFIKKNLMKVQFRKIFLLTNVRLKFLSLY